MIRRSSRSLLVGTALALLALGGCSVIAPLDGVNGNAGSGGGRGSGNAGSGGNDGPGEAGSCFGVYDEARFDQTCFQ